MTADIGKFLSLLISRNRCLLSQHHCLGRLFHTHNRGGTCIWNLIIYICINLCDGVRLKQQLLNANVQFDNKKKLSWFTREIIMLLQICISFLHARILKCHRSTRVFVSSYLFWVDERNHRIERALLDGSHRRTLVKFRDSFPKQLSVSISRK